MPPRARGPKGGAQRDLGTPMEVELVDEELIDLSRRRGQHAEEWRVALASVMPWWSVDDVVARLTDDVKLDLAWLALQWVRANAARAAAALIVWIMGWTGNASAWASRMTS